MHPYTRIQTPNIKLANCYYRRKSYRTFGCDARVQMREKLDEPGMDECLVSGEHSELCKQKNRIKPRRMESNLQIFHQETRLQKQKLRMCQRNLRKDWWNWPPKKFG